MTPQEFIQRAVVVHELRPAYVVARPLEDGDWICAMTAISKTGRPVFVASPNVANGNPEVLNCSTVQVATDCLLAFREGVGPGFIRIPVTPSAFGIVHA